VDFESADDGKVTVRERDSMEQERISFEGAADYLSASMEGSR
jgi:glycyl-tRNA synthetase